MWLLTLPMLAFAQQIVEGGAVPEMNAQTFRPTIDGVIETGRVDNGFQIFNKSIQIL